MTAPKEIKRLIERFQDNRDVYCSSQYNEAQARIEFIDPFFKALGWDMTNEKGYAEAYKEVIHEDAIKVGGATLGFEETLWQVAYACLEVRKQHLKMNIATV